MHLAQELEQEGNHRSAEKHYVEAGDWKSAVHMYRLVKSLGPNALVLWMAALDEYF